MKRVSTIHFLAVLLLVCICAVPTVGSGQDKVVTLRYSDQFPPADPLTAVGEQWCKEVEKRTNGRVKVRYYPASALNSPGQTYESVVQGVIDIGNHFIPYTQGRFPQINAIDQLPWLYTDNIQVTAIANQFYEKFKPKEFDNVKVMYFHCAAPNILLLRKPLNKLEDLKGMRIRSMTPNAQILGEFGATALGMPMGEVYDALSKSVIDGLGAPYQAFTSWKLADHIKYVVEYQGTALIGFAVVAMNKNKWNSIPLDAQKIIEVINKEWAMKHAGVWAAGEKQGKELAISKGVKITKLSAEEQAKWDVKASPLFDAYIANMKKKNLPGQEAVNFIRDALKK